MGHIRAPWSDPKPPSLRTWVYYYLASTNTPDTTVITYYTYVNLVAPGTVFPPIDVREVQASCWTIHTRIAEEPSSPPREWAVAVRAERATIVPCDRPATQSARSTAADTHVAVRVEPSQLPFRQPSVYT